MSFELQAEIEEFVPLFNLFLLSLWQSQLFLVCKYRKYFVGFWLCQCDFPVYFIINVAIFKFPDALRYFCAVFIVVLKSLKWLLPSFFWKLSPNSYLFSFLVKFLLSIWHFELSFCCWKDVYFFSRVVKCFVFSSFFLI